MARFGLAHILLWVLTFGLVNSSAHQNQVQFYDKSSRYGIGITSALYENGTQVRLTIVAPVKYGWAAVGVGNVMDGSPMFILYPDKTGLALTLSIRSASGHNTPTSLQSGKIDAVLTNSSIENGFMHALIHWRDNAVDVLHGSLRVTNPMQPFIWAVGPSQMIKSDDIDYPINEHDSHGVFFADMTQSQNKFISDPDVQGVENMDARPQPKRYFLLIVVHACFLVTAFVGIFPAAVIGLRLNWPSSFKIHWMSQLTGTVFVLAGFVTAVFTSIMGIRYSSLTEPHQILGILMSLSVGLQVYFGREHHIHYVLNDGKRSWYSRVHFILGRIVMYGGMVNAVLGFRLAGLQNIAIGAAIFNIAVIIAVEFMCARYNSKRAKNLIPDIEPLILNDLRKSHLKEMAPEEIMLSQVDVNTGYMR